MRDGLILFGSGLDQSLPTEHQFQWVKEQINQRIEKAIQSANLDEATELVRDLVMIAKVAGKELAKVLYTFHEQWKTFDTQETFEEWADRTTGFHVHTIERYIRIETMLNKPEIPTEIRQELADRNLAELFPIANMVEQGYEPSSDQWESILIQPDEVSIRTKVREIKGQEPRATALVLRVDDVGSIWAHKDGAKKFVGSLEITDEEPIVKSAVERIIRNSGMLK